MRVARNAVWSRILVPGEELRQLPPDHVGEEHVAVRWPRARAPARCAAARAAPAPRRAGRAPRDRWSRAAPRGCRLAARDERERMGRVEGDRRQHREDLALEADRAASLVGPARAPRARTKTMPSFSSAGRSSRFQQRRARPSARAPRRRSPSAAPPGVRPSGVRLVMPASTCWRRLATRTSKNSERFESTIARKRTRSSSGLPSRPAPPRARAG